MLQKEVLIKGKSGMASEGLKEQNNQCDQCQGNILLQTDSHYDIRPTENEMHS